jgi:hypothetical protein
MRPKRGVRSSATPSFGFDRCWKMQATTLASLNAVPVGEVPSRGMSTGGEMVGRGAHGSSRNCSMLGAAGFLILSQALLGLDDGIAGGRRCGAMARPLAPQASRCAPRPEAALALTRPRNPLICDRICNRRRPHSSLDGTTPDHAHFTPPAPPHGSLTPAELPLIDAEKLFRQPGHLDSLPPDGCMSRPGLGPVSVTRRETVEHRFGTLKKRSSSRPRSVGR